MTEEMEAGSESINADEITETVDSESEENDSYFDQYQCGICAKLFPTKEKFLEHHVSMLGNQNTCCNCKKQFTTSTILYKHHETHNLDEENVILEERYSGADVTFEELVLNYDDGEVIVQQPARSEDNDLLYILDDNQCLNEVFIQEDNLCQAQQSRQQRQEWSKRVKARKGTVAPLNFKRRLSQPREEIFEEIEQNRKMVTKRLISVRRATTNKRAYISSNPRVPQPKRRHEVPNFTATNYVFVHANEEIGIAHYKCLRCEQLFINKVVFFRHIEKGKCYNNNCDACSATFTRNADFYEHYVQEHADRAICNFCFRTFMYEKNVKEHMLRHLDQFRHKCTDCNKGFYTVREYRNHYKNRHMGIRHKCEVCGRSFADEYYFRKHIATHAKAPNITVLEMAE